ncbi:hypothetical protein T265_07718 [Opisthorchis viverrini]|uniref:Uncharacterized protein n=1 Tax=Opisthorchis viverrini TaxID=6198 RepID=A0A074ZBM4_OPIVI|nr:hypothetical protein T265_07718 [Opisthorchis viverrini]KER24671.1 hypothetical protein T265_07718 [Opisthorchis viverrini]
MDLKIKNLEYPKSSRLPRDCLSNLLHSFGYLELLLPICTHTILSAVAPFRCLAVMPPERSTRAGILLGCPSLDRGSR